MSARDAIERLPDAVDVIDSRLNAIEQSMGKLSDDVMRELGELRNLVLSLRSDLGPAIHAGKEMPAIKRRLEKLEHHERPGNGAG
jgi:Mg2+ and Co2+ transporter CorA